MSETRLIFETSSRTCRVGIARGEAIVRSRTLAETRRLARDLAPAVAELLQDERLTPRQIDQVMVSIGPGSYTGLRVGIMAAKALAYAAGCELIAVPTFAAIALQAGADEPIWVIGDALQGLIYIQRFDRDEALDELRIVPVVESLPELPSSRVFGPGLAVHNPARVGIISEPSLESVLRVGLRLSPLSRGELFALEPLYLRGSSAEEKAKANEPRG